MSTFLFELYNICGYKKSRRRGSAAVKGVHVLVSRSGRPDRIEYPGLLVASQIPEAVSRPVRVFGVLHDTWEKTDVVAHGDERRLAPVSQTGYRP
jgi:hypothetical protein